MQKVVNWLLAAAKYIRDTWTIAVYFYYAYKILLKMPMNEWQTYGQLKAMGCPDKQLYFVLHLFVAKGVFEARVSIKTLREWIHPEFADEVIEPLKNIPFEPTAPELFEYRYNERPPQPERDVSWAGVRNALPSAA